ncbi:ATP-binding cassette domain-containing protein [Aggregatibacter actinomycetemcomitans]|uniref:ATP-binding cassette domain-containing protein n=1 Tax=Aggregatibacter actinomycetemcomitans TaxID=714 RepID=UPI0011DAE8F3|nr:ATP-binding cassette domain-containing protein [Aggregatibacter actinomycetemcomitans]QEH47701.1 ATP-binding cassette domain-containing protein [Aggregatibacter actinomycetemcomitans]TYA49559.1 ATP-binding cassette domain-containing protein [Aggregatibacter actinomycetemcomitans]
MTEQIELKHIYKSFGQTKVLQDFNLSFQKHKFTTLLGASGCGKTSILRLIAGLEEPDKGQILCDGRDLSRLAPQQRGVGFVFQSYALFPHLTVSENVAFGLKMQDENATNIAAKVKNVLKMVELDGFEMRRIEQLSGGQQQRVALARALVIAPQILLFDEPLSNLDTNLRRTLREMIRHLQQQLNITTLYVTHDQSEAFAVSDEVVVMNQGKVEQIGTPSELYRAPASRFTATFMGDASFFPVQSKNGKLFMDKNPLSLVSQTGATDGNYQLGIRPEGVLLGLQGESVAQCTIQSAVFMGNYWEIHALWLGLPLLIHLNPNDYIPNQPRYFVQLRPIGWFLLPAEG